MTNTPEDNVEHRETADAIPDLQTSATGGTDLLHELEACKKLILEYKSQKAEKAKSIEELQNKIKEIQGMLTQCLLSELPQ